MRVCKLLLLALCFCSATAHAVILAKGDGTGNTSAPPDDPGFANVGALNGATAVYLRDGWVITANHVGAGNPILGGIPYTFVQGSAMRLMNSDGSPADVLMLRVDPFPPLPETPVLSKPPEVGADVIMIGRGVNRGTATTWNGFPGWFYGSGQTMRWGTNTVASRDLYVLGTRAFQTIFGLPIATPYEAQAATGDSGGAVFVRSGGKWQLGGIIFAVSPHYQQPGSSAIYGNITYSVQLSDYAAQISGLLALPVCGDGLDNDGDGYIDARADPGCLDARSMTESPACDNGRDDDGDGLTDLKDPDCMGQRWVPFETLPEDCGQGFDFALVAPVLAHLGARRGRRSRKRSSGQPPADGPLAGV
jgi:hypothetical protein